MHNLSRGSIDDMECSSQCDVAGAQGTHGEPGGDDGGSDRSDEKKPLAEAEALQRAKHSFPGEYFIPTFAEVQH